MLLPVDVMAPPMMINITLQGDIVESWCEGTTPIQDGLQTKNENLPNWHWLPQLPERGMCSVQ